MLFKLNLIPHVPRNSLILNAGNVGVNVAGHDLYAKGMRQDHRQRALSVT